MGEGVNVRSAGRGGGEVIRGYEFNNAELPLRPLSLGEARKGQRDTEIQLFMLATSRQQRQRPA